VKRTGLFFLLLSASGLQAQILDDSTKLVYGPSTTTYVYEENIKYNDLWFVEVDTSIINIHRYTTTELSGYKLQDLGVIGTATRSIYYKPPSIIGARAGFYAYEPFFKPPQEFKYYDTKSPYSRIGAAVGGRGRSRVDVGFNRSDSSNFNIGIDYNRVISDKQVNSIGRHDRLTDSEGYDIYLVYYTPNRRYLALTNFSRNKNTIVDQGGIDTTGNSNYFDENAIVFLQNARSEYLRRNYHFYHQFNLDSAIQFYQSYDYSYTSAKFRDENLGDEGDYFSQFNFSTDSTSEENNFKTKTLETGVKGSLGKLFYLGYYKIRGFDFIYGKGESDTLNFRTSKPETKGVEHYVGGMIRIQLNRKYKLTGSIDFNLNGNQRLTGDLLAKNFDVSFVMQQYSPSFMDKAYLGNHDFWINDFKNIKTIGVEGGYNQKIGRSFFRLKANFSTVTDYIYYNTIADTIIAPQQINGTTTLITPGLDFSINFYNNFYLTGDATYSLVSGNTPEAFPIPDLMINLNIFYHRLLFKGHLELQAGLENHWKSDYFAPDFRITTQQFFIQDSFNVPSYLIADAYMNIKLGHAYVFAKYNNLVQAFTKEGYFVAPNYVGKRNLFDFGFYWQFFD
jgi:Putative porin